MRGSAHNPEPGPIEMEEDVVIPLDHPMAGKVQWSNVRQAAIFSKE